MAFTVRVSKKGKLVFESQAFDKKKAMLLAEDIRQGKTTKSGRWAKNGRVSVKRFS